MTRSPSLSRRLGFSLLFVLLLGWIFLWGVFIWTHYFEPIAPSQESTADLAFINIEPVILESIVRGPDGAPRFEPVAELKKRLAQDPELKILVWDAHSCALLAGSALESTSPLVCGSPVEIRNFDFRIRDESGAVWNGFATRRDTKAGTVLVAMWGARLRQSDLWGLLGAFLWLPGGWFSLPIFVIAAAISWFLVGRGLAPLRNVVAQLDRVDLDTADARLPENDIPIEVAPLVTALNGALARIEAGVARRKRFLANAAHEIRMPIAVLRTRLDNPRDEDLRKDLRRGLRRLQAISEQLLASARISAQGGMDAARELLDLTAIVRTKGADYAPLAVENGRRIEFEGSSSPIMVSGCRHAFESIIANLIDNALRAEPEGGAVILRLSPHATLEVIDHGEGVAPEHRELIFEPFWRKADTTGGMGLGLAITKELVEKLGGRIWVEDTPGGGATFKLRFRAADIA